MIAVAAIHGIVGLVADAIYEKAAAFADFGFPESRSVSFAPTWSMRRRGSRSRYPAGFAAARLNAQPMGFYSPNTLAADAPRHGVTVLGPDIDHSGYAATLAASGAPSAAGHGAFWCRKHAPRVHFRRQKRPLFASA